MEIFLIRALQLILALSILVFIHELGHFIFARIFKVRVTKFYMFFDWGFALLMRPSKHSKSEDKALIKLPPGKGDTEYGIGWLPLGGYCQISGMIDESMNTEQMKQPVQPWEFRAKPAWQRLLIMIGGVLFNFIMAMLIYSMVMFTWGDSHIDIQKAPYGMEFNEKAEAIGFVDGDIITKVGENEVHRCNVDLLRGIADSKNVTVLRGGKETTITVPDTFGLLDMGKETPFVDIRIPAVIDSVYPKSTAAIAGIQPGDSIVELGGKAIGSWQQFKIALQEFKTAGKGNLTVTVMRDTLTTLKARMDSTYIFGVEVMQPEFQIMTTEYGFFESFPAGISYGCNVLKGYVSDFKYLFSKEGAKSVGMFGTIGSLFPEAWNWHRFWMMTAMLSIILAVMNILPIPALDGGHVVFLLVEVITRRKPSDKVLEYAQMIGMILLLGLFVLATWNDLTRFVF